MPITSQSFTVTSILSSPKSSQQLCAYFRTITDSDRIQDLTSPFFSLSLFFFFDIVIVFCHANVAKFSESSTDSCSIPDRKGLEATRD